VHPAATGRAIALLAGFTVFLVGLNRYFGRHGVRGIVPGLVGLGVLIAIIGIVQKAVLGDHAWMGMKIYGFWAPHYKLTTPFGPFVNKNHYAGWMLMTLPLAVGYLIGLAESGAAHVRPRWRDRLLWLSSPEGGRLQLSAFAIVIMGAALALTKSRSGIGCFALTIAAAGVTAARGQRSARTRVGIIGAVAVLVAVPLLWADVDLATRFTSGGESVELRRQAWGDALAVMRDFPLAGTGLNTYGSATLLYNTAQTDLHFQEAHNDYVQLAAEGGLLLAIPALVAIGACVRGVRRRLAEDRRDPMRYWIRFGAATGLAAIAIQSAVEFSLQMPGNAVLFVVLCAIALHERVPPMNTGPVTRAR
jgi:O-antigen ligase